MAWTGSMHREAGPWGSNGSNVPVKELGTFKFGKQPENGQVVDLEGVLYEVSAAFDRYCHVRPMVMKGTRVPGE